MSRSFIEEARRRQIIEAATAVVAESGYAQASLSRIAEHAGISKSVISYHFDGKAELLEEVVRRFLDDVWEQMERQLDAADSTTERVRAWVTSEMSAYGADPQGFLAMVEIVTNHRRADGTRPFEVLEQEGLDTLTSILEEGQRTGELRDFDAPTIAQVISHTMEAALGHWAHDGSVDLDQHVPVIADFVLHAIRTEPT